MHCDTVWYWNGGFHFPNLTFDLVYPDGRCTGVWCDVVIDRVVLLGVGHRYVLSVTGGNHLVSAPVNQNLGLAAYVFHLQQVVTDVLRAEAHAEEIRWTDVVLSVEHDCRLACHWLADRRELVEVLASLPP